ncbi:hypothetical protein [Chitinophaga rhizophila]|uniref:Tryptophan-rich sensory protein n=1 Tax=Chitinophaga rhizophila TaxID=2866212 RepID=A0ABS7GJP2_9BACT|nr:hypothetical protein [Chitinophaga rhizophila]MBW8687606.1 hypothetical protein [Chitinophaga rhizophila]
MTTTHKTLYYKNRAIFNTIGYIVVIVVNMLANLNVINNRNTGDISDKYDNLFVPAGVTFSIWGVIYLTLLGFIIYQLWLAFSKGHTEALGPFMERLRGWWLISCMANSCWLFAWHYELLAVSVLLMLTLLVCLLAIHLNFNIALPRAGTRIEKLFIHVPFSLYLGWICVATVANIAAFLVYLGWNGMSVPGTIFLILLCTIGSTLLIIRRHNIIVGLVAIWALYGIIMKRQSIGGAAEMPIIYACLGAMLIITISGIWRKIADRRLS